MAKCADNSCTSEVGIGSRRGAGVCSVFVDLVYASFACSTSVDKDALKAHEHRKVVETRAA